MLDVVDLTKSYGAVQALDGVSLHVDQGEIVGLLGPNGAGKSTTIKILTGYLQPDEGQATINGLDVLTQTREVQRQIGYLPESAPLYPELSVQEYLSMIAELREIPEDERLARLSEAIYATGLQEMLTRPIGHLSKGFRQRVGLAQAIVHRPSMLILDEPSIGLDPTQIVEMRKLIKRLAANSTVLFSTHILSEVEALCDRVVILMNGEVRADARLDDLSASRDALLLLSKTVSGAVAALGKIRGVSQVAHQRTPEGYGQYRVSAKAGAGDLCPAIYDLAREQGWPLRELRPDVRTLEAVFNDLATAVR